MTVKRVFQHPAKRLNLMLYKMESGMKVLYAVLCCVSAVVSWSCDSTTLLETQRRSPGRSLGTDVVQVRRYARWEKPYSGERTFTGDTTSIFLMAKEPGKVTFFESTVHADPTLPTD